MPILWGSSDKATLLHWITSKENVSVFQSKSLDCDAA